MANSFSGFSNKALTFFRELEKSNDRGWFSAHKEIYEQEVRQPMLQLVEIICQSFARFAPDYVPERPEKAIYRIYRDTRFSRDKTPYKTHIAAHLQHRLIEKNRGAGYYFEISHEGLGIAGGIYMPGPEQLLAIRRKIEKDHKQFEKIINSRALRRRFGDVLGDAAVRVPKGFSPDHPAASWIKYRQLYFYVELDAREAISPRLPSEIMAYFKPLEPFISFLNDGIIESLREEDSRPKRPEPMF